MEEKLQLIGQSTPIKVVQEQIKKVAHSHSSVLILGASGTGKELVARLIHQSSHREKKQFVAVNCAAIPADLLESELFGHEKGAFTGAVQTRIGRFEIAQGGTLLLDEIGDMPLAMQVKLLRILQEKSFERIGSNKSIKTDARVIAATNKNLESLIEAGQFREDLYYRLNVYPIEIPALKDRPEDVPLLLDFYLAQFNQANQNQNTISEAARAILASYDWPGNVRELSNFVERFSLIHQNKMILPEDLPEKFLQLKPCNAKTEQFSSIWAHGPHFEWPLDLKDVLQNLEIDLIKKALLESGAIVSHAADKLGIKRTTLVEKIKKYGLGHQA